MSTANPEPYSERVRLIEIISDARDLLAAQPFVPQEYDWPGRVGRLEAMLKALADSAEIVASEKA